jgi:hypothetical protein
MHVTGSILFLLLYARIKRCDTYLGGGFGKCIQCGCESIKFMNQFILFSPDRLTIIEFHEQITCALFIMFSG